MTYVETLLPTSKHAQKLEMVSSRAKRRVKRGAKSRDLVLKRCAGTRLRLQYKVLRLGRIRASLESSFAQDDIVSELLAFNQSLLGHVAGYISASKPRMQRVIPHHSESGDADVSDGNPSLQLVMPGAMEDVGDPN